MVSSDYRKNEPGIIVGQSGREWLIVVDPWGWSMNGLKYGGKLPILLDLGKKLPGAGWIEVKVDIHWDNDKKEFIVKRQYCDPFVFPGDVIYATVK